MLTAWKAHGRLFGKTHLRPIFSCWRGTDKQLDWVLNPGDPNLIEDENIMTVIAHYIVTIWAVCDKKLRESTSYDVKITASEVIDHMVERALKYPVLLCVLLQLRMSEMLLVLLELEKNADANAYKAMLRFLAVFCCAAHKKH